jgi:hypothetical protein
VEEKEILKKTVKTPINFTTPGDDEMTDVQKRIRDAEKKNDLVNETDEA